MKVQTPKICYLFIRVLQLHNYFFGLNVFNFLKFGFNLCSLGSSKSCLIVSLIASLSNFLTHSHYKKRNHADHKLQNGTFPNIFPVVFTGVRIYPIFLNPIICFIGTFESFSSHFFSCNSQAKKKNSCVMFQTNGSSYRDHIDVNCLFVFRRKLIIWSHSSCKNED